MGIRVYVIRRILMLIPTLIGLSLLVFAVMQMFSPTQRAVAFVRSTAQMRNLPLIIEQYGLNDPVHVQYMVWINELFRGNLGFSRTYHSPVLRILLSRAAATAELVIYSAPPTIILGIYLGVKSAIHRDKAIDHATRTFSIIGWSLPTFWLAIILLSIFYAGLQWFPPGRLGADANIFVHSEQWITYTGLLTIDGLLNRQFWVSLDALRHLVLPVITLTVVQIALIVRVMRSSMLEALGKGYIVTAKAKGLSQKEVINKHARRNALIPVITVSGILTAGMLTGVVITETVFNFHGLGEFAATAATQLDFPAVLGFALLSGIIFLVANLIVDILYAYVDPRIRLG